MSKILDKLKEAEAQRERIVAERKRLEAEADAALAARDLDERAARARPELPVIPRAEPEALERIEAQEIQQAAIARERKVSGEKMLRAAVRRQAEAEAEARQIAEARAKAEERGGQPEPLGKMRWLAAGAVVVAGISSVLFFYGTPNKKETAAGSSSAVGFQLKLDRDLESFSKRLQEKEKP